MRAVRRGRWSGDQPSEDRHSVVVVRRTCLSLSPNALNRPPGTHLGCPNRQWTSADFSARDRVPVHVTELLDPLTFIGLTNKEVAVHVDGEIMRSVHDTVRLHGRKVSGPLCDLAPATPRRLWQFVDLVL